MLQDAEDRCDQLIKSKVEMESKVKGKTCPCSLRSFLFILAAFAKKLRPAFFAYSLRT